MPEIRKKIVFVDGEKEKKEKNTISSMDPNKTMGDEYQMILNSRVGDTLNSIVQGKLYLDKLYDALLHIMSE